MRALTFQSMYRTSSPGSYSRMSARSMPCPRKSVRYSPWSRPSSRRMTVHSTRLRMASGSCCDTFLQRLRRRRDLLEHAIDDLLGRDVVRQRLVRQHEPVTQHVVDEIEDVLREDVRAAAHERERAAGEDEVDRRARARAVGDVLLDLRQPVLRR